MTIELPRMRQQFAAQAVVEELLRHQSETPQRTAFGRFFGYSPLGDDSASWYLGAQGEIVVGAILDAMPPDWAVFHALPVGTKGADIDHLVIGPGGIFTINTKHHNGKAVWVAGRTLMVSGQKQQYIRNAEFEAKRVSKMLTERMPQLAPAQPVLALVNPKSLSIKKQPENVKVLTAGGLWRWLLARPTVMSADEVHELAAVFDDPGTWAMAALPPTENALEHFKALELEVRSARVRRTLWKLLGLAAVTVAAMLLGPPLITALFDTYAAAVVHQ
ncbi:nuclease-related domain-containing protein [Leifsonia sp. YAF41]|uniref:nuclease-related domain-containing protein n=1 Tax=Leifsonia sp. YAF41 TaxID=3233086 RepID=UPI003F96F2B7